MQDWTGNKNSIYKTLGASNHTPKDREQDDYYATDPKAIDALIKSEKLNNRIWECACGAGHLSERLIEKGYFVYSSDIKDRGYKRLNALKDFLEAERAPYDAKYDIVTNPPYKYAKEFVLKSLELLPEGCKCCMFLKIQFLEGKTRYKELYSKFSPKTVHVFSERIICAKNADFEGVRAGGGSAVAYAWYIWQKGYKGETKIKWI